VGVCEKIGEQDDGEKQHGNEEKRDREEHQRGSKLLNEIRMQSHGRDKRPTEPFSELLCHGDSPRALTGSLVQLITKALECFVLQGMDQIDNWTGPLYLLDAQRTRGTARIACRFAE